MILEMLALIRSYLKIFSDQLKWKWTLLLGDTKFMPLSSLNKTASSWHFSLAVRKERKECYSDYLEGLLKFSEEACLCLYKIGMDAI